MAGRFCKVVWHSGGGFAPFMDRITSCVHGRQSLQGGGGYSPNLSRLKRVLIGGTSQSISRDGLQFLFKKTINHGARSSWCNVAGHWEPYSLHQFTHDIIIITPDWRSAT
eukprot:1159341-Pelagomonas_calceolata.AAC.4